ncbi:MAG: asparagine synthase (glutamine-hydrolyzing) [Patescibacteria group bacterium]
MCGINGFNFKDQGLIEKMIQSTRRRGPDGQDFYVDDEISLGHNLLAITNTPAEGRQPFLSPDKNFVLIYNGEIYNYKKLKSELEAKGYKFHTQGDTEVLLQGLIEEGIDFVKKLDGMFAFAFLNKKAKKLYLARDRMGMKPFYYHYNGGKLIFSSELRGILIHGIDRKLNIESLNIFFILGYVPGPKTLIQNVNKVCPGQILIFDLQNKTLDEKWFGGEERFDENTEFNPDYLREKIGKSVLAHTMGLRPFGLYLSGGLDSTVILHELVNNGVDIVRTYTTRFDINNESFNEDADFAKRLTQDYKIEHHELLVNENDFITATEKVFETIEEPRYNPSIAAYWLLAKFAAKDIVVVLSGNGGDELFFGYPKYFESRKISNRYRKYPSFLMNLWHEINFLRKKRIKFGHSLKLDQSLDRWTYLNKVNFVLDDKLLKFPLKSDLHDLKNYLASIKNPIISQPLEDIENSIAELDRLFWLADEEFLRTDKITMNFGMEGRFPLLAKEVVRYANSIPSDKKLAEGQSKSLIRQAYKNHLPDYIINKRKSGWRAPIVKWMHSKFGKMVKEVLSDHYYSPTSHLFNLNSIRKNYIDSIPEFTSVNIKKFMPIFAFQIWAEKFKIKL